MLPEFASASGIGLPEGPYETVAGFVINRLGRIPPPCDTVEVGGHILSVTAMDKLRIIRIRVAAGDWRPKGP